MTAFSGLAGWARLMAICAMYAVALAACGDGEQSARVPLEPTTVAPVEAPAPIASLTPPERAQTPPPLVDALPPGDGPAALPQGGSRLSALANIDAGALTPAVLRQTLAKGLAEPVDLGVLADGTVFVVERARGLLVVTSTRDKASVFTPKDLAPETGGGMLGLAIDPQFDRTRRVFVFMTSSLGATPENRVVQLTLDTRLAAVSDRADIVIGIRFASPPRAVRPPETAHHGGRLAFGPDGHLYMATGDGHMGQAAQSAHLAGRVLRIDVTERLSRESVDRVADPQVRVSGLRDPAGVAFHPLHEGLVVADRGGAMKDEATVVPPGAPPDNLPLAKAAPPFWRSSAPGDGLAAMTRLHGPSWRHWNGAFAMAFDAGQRIDLVKIDARNAVIAQSTLLRGLGYGFSAIAQGPDGLYVTTRGKSGGEELVRLTVQY